MKLADRAGSHLQDPVNALSVARSAVRPERWFRAANRSSRLRTRLPFSGLYLNAVLELGLSAERATAALATRSVHAASGLRQIQVLQLKTTDNKV